MTELEPNTEKIAVQQREYRNANREKRAAYDCEYRETWMRLLSLV